MPGIENISISISANADSAINALERLASTLSRVQNVMHSFNASNVINTLRQVKESALDASNVLNRYATAQNKANRAADGYNAKHTVSGMRDVENSANDASNALMRYSSVMGKIRLAIGGSSDTTAMVRSFASAFNEMQMAVSGADNSDYYDTTFADVANGAADVSDSSRKATKYVEAFGQALRSLVKWSGQAGSQTLQAGMSIGKSFVGAAKGATSAIGGFIAGLLRIAKFRIFRTLVKDLGQSFKDLYGWSTMFGTGYAQSVDRIITASTYFRNSLAAMASPLVNAIAPALDFIVDKIVEVMNWLNQLFAVLTGANTYTVAKKVARTWEDALKGTAKTAKDTTKEIKRTILGFDEINKLTDTKDPSSGGGSGSSPYTEGFKEMFEERELSQGFKGFSQSLEKAISDTTSRIALIVSGASVAVGALLAFTGVNVPLGIGLIASGILGAAATLDWSFLDKETYKTLKRIMAVVSLGFVGVGAILAFSGTNIPLGITLLAAGAYGTAKSLDWDVLSVLSYSALRKVIGIASLASVGVGLILALSGTAIPLGIGLIAAGALGTAATLNWEAMGLETYSALKKVVAVAALGQMGVGLILALSGINIPLGIGLIASGATFGAVALNWDALGIETYSALRKVMAIASIGALGVGLILALSGTNLPIGIGLIAAGVAGAAAAIDWNALSMEAYHALKTIINVVSIGAVGVGAILAFSGVNIPLGITLLATGAFGIARANNWFALSTETYSAIKQVMGVVSLGSMGVGAVLAFSGINIPLGITLLAAGIVGIAKSTNWNSIGDKTYNTLKTVMRVVGMALMGVGAVLAFSGINVPLGITLLATGALGAAKTVNWDALKNKTYDTLKRIMAVVSLGAMGVGAVLAFSGINIPLGITLMAAGAFGAAKSDNWTALQNKISPKLSALVGIISGASLALGIFALIAGNVPLGLGLILAGSAGLAKTISANWDNIKQLGADAINKVKEGWDAANVYFELKIKPVLANVKEIFSNVGEKASTAVTGLSKPGGVTDFLGGLLGALGGKQEDLKVDLKVNAVAGNNIKSDAFSKGLSVDIEQDKKISTIIEGVPGQGVKQNGYGIGRGGSLAADFVDGQKTTITVDAFTAWQHFGMSLMKWIGADRLDTEVTIEPWTPWQNWRHTSLINYLGLDRLATTISVTATLAGSLANMLFKKKEKGGIYVGGTWSDIPQYAGGTTNATSHGSMFIAGEAGPEIVGHVGGRTEVLNKSQIAAAMYSAVRSAMSGITLDANIYKNDGVDSDESMALLLELVQRGADATQRQNDLIRQQNDLLRQLNDKDYSTTISTADISRAQARQNRRAGTTIVPVGT